MHFSRINKPVDVNIIDKVTLKICKVNINKNHNNIWYEVKKIKGGFSVTDKNIINIQFFKKGYIPFFFFYHRIIRTS